MTTSGTWSFNPSLGALIIDAFGRIGIKRAAITQDHMYDASFQANMLLADWASKQPLLWTSETQNLGTLTQGTATYTPAARTVAVLTAYIRTGTGTNQVDRVIGPLSTVEYESMPNKNTQGPPTSFWFDRLIAPTITLWPAPDNGGPYTLLVQTVSQVQDASVAGGTTMFLPYRYMDAFAADLAHRMARFYAPQLEQVRAADAMQAWQTAFGNDVESVPLFITPGLSSYYR